LHCLALVSLCGAVLENPAQTNDPPALYLTWQRDPTRTMTIHWHTTEPDAESKVQFRKRGDTNWHAVAGSAQPMPHSDRLIHTVELTELEPQTDYRFRFGTNSTAYKFRTMPADLARPIRFIAGGDLYHEKNWMDQMNALAARFDPAFVMIGGDLAYANEKAEQVGRWYTLFDSWKKFAVAPDGRLIPLLVTIGNHEVRGYWYQTPAEAATFYRLFSMPGPRGYGSLDFGDYLTVFLLDSWHTHPVGGEQRAWLEARLAQRQHVPHLIPLYHVAAYPSARPFDGGESGPISAAIREHWSPLFEQYGVRLVFENHDHTFKRTHPIRAGKIHPEGVVYLGDGAWGVHLRKTHPVESTWYLARTGTIRHFHLVTLYADQRHVLAINDKGEIFDELYQRANCRKQPAEEVSLEPVNAR
jgi:acid phosphatase type 7